MLGKSCIAVFIAVSFSTLPPVVQRVSVFSLGALLLLTSTSFPAAQIRIKPPHFPEGKDSYISSPVSVSLCLPVLLCPRVWTSLENGRVTAKPPGQPVEGTVLHYSCHAGFILEGRNISHCTKLGKWDAPKPTCLCEYLSPVTNAKQTVDFQQHVIALCFFPL